MRTTKGTKASKMIEVQQFIQVHCKWYERATQFCENRPSVSSRVKLSAL